MDVSNLTPRNNIKAYFQKYEIPTQTQFEDMLTTMLSMADDGIAKLTGQPLSIQSEGDEQILINFYDSFGANMQPSWILSQNANDKAGFNFREFSGVSRLFIRSGSGQVGINTNDPAKKLHVQEGELHVKGSHNLTTPDLGAFYALNGQKGIGIGSNRIQAVGSNNDQDILLLPKGSGRLGVNTDSPSATLSVEGNAIFNDDIAVKNTTNEGEDIFKFYHTSGNAISEWYHANTIKNLIQANGDSYFNSGNIGIGTDTPGAKLEVSGAAKATSLKTNTINAIDTDGLALYDKDQDGIFIKDGGNVGIGTTDPLGKLDIAGSVWKSHFCHGDNEDTYIRPGTNSGAVIMDKGNVGIGTGNPTAKLEINGNVKVAGHTPFKFRRYTNISNVKDTGVNPSLYNAAIVGFRAFGGDINEGDVSSTTNLIRARMIVVNNQWRIDVDFRSHSDEHEKWDIYVMFVRTEISERNY